MEFRIMAHRNSPTFGAAQAFLKDNGKIIVFNSEEDCDAMLKKLREQTKSPFVWYTKYRYSNPLTNPLTN